MQKNRLEVLPAYFWLHNLYALERNSWKARNRDKRVNRIQHIETDYLAPDTVEEIINALALLELWISEAGYSAKDAMAAGEDIKLISARNLERGRREQVILKPLKAIAAYHRMLRYYAVKTIAVFFDSLKEIDFDCFVRLLGPPDPVRRIRDWVNMGGQIVPAVKVDRLREQIREKDINTWQEIHSIYDSWHIDYPLDKVLHAWSVLALLNNWGGNSTLFEDSPFDAATFRRELSGALKTRQWLTRQIYETRAKDFRNSFRRAVFRNQAEMEQVVGPVAANTFVKLAEEEDIRFTAMIERILAKL